MLLLLLIRERKRALVLEERQFEDGDTMECAGDPNKIPWQMYVGWQARPGKKVPTLTELRMYPDLMYRHLVLYLCIHCFTSLTNQPLT